MRKILAAALTLILILAAAGCSPKQETEPSVTQNEQTATQAKTEAPTAEPTPTEEPTPTVEPAPTPDADPSSKLMVTGEEFAELLNLWPVSSSPIEEHGDILSFSISSQYGFDASSVNFMFDSEKSSRDSFDFYSSLIEGEWEDSQYSAGPSVYGGLMEETIKTTCQVATVDGNTEVFLGMFIDNGGAELDALFDAHWPIGLFDLHESFTEDAGYFKRFEYKPGESLSFADSWETQSAEKAAEILDFYKELLAGEENYEYFEGGEYESAYVTCTISGINCKVAVSMETYIELTLSMSME